MKTILKDKWDKLYNNIGLSSNYNFSEVTFEILFQNYFYDENRHYHSAEHIRSCLENLEEIKKNSKFIEYVDYIAIELAIWFHDFIYDTRKNNNEALSALAAKQFIFGMLNNNTSLAKKVESLILFTKHDREPENIEEKILSDIDLFILSAYDVIEYDGEGYLSNIRKEYYWAPDFVYYPGRLKILEKFYNKREIFYTPYFKDEYVCEDNARLNILKEIDSIKKRLILINGNVK